VSELGPRPYTVQEAADTFDRNPGTIRRWIRTGRLPAKLVGRRYEIDSRVVDKLLEPDLMPLPEAWGRTVTSEPMPNVVGAVRRVRAERGRELLRAVRSRSTS
jgi:excisionase family DNA binding protein